MKRININFFNSLTLLFVLMFVACDEDVPVENTNAILAEGFFERLTQIDAAVNASYNQFQNPLSA